MASTGRADREAMASPLWPLVVILGDVARRVKRHRLAEQAEANPDAGSAGGGDPAARGEAA